MLINTHKIKKVLKMQKYAFFKLLDIVLRKLLFGTFRKKSFFSLKSATFNDSGITATAPSTTEIATYRWNFKREVGDTV